MIVNVLIGFLMKGSLPVGGTASSISEKSCIQKQRFNKPTPLYLSFMVSNFTPAFNASEQVHYNVSYIIANQPVQMTTPTVWVVFTLVGIGLLLLSVLNLEDTCNDLSGILASAFLFISAIQAFAVDTVTGFGVTSLLDSGVHEFVLMENHTIYHYDLFGVALGIMFIISLANLYRLWLDSRRVTEQKMPSLDSRDRNPRQSQSQSQSQYDQGNDNDR